jgi:hypothetical protein
MRVTAALLGTLITLTLTTAAVGAMTADMRLVARRAEARETALHATMDPVWLGGELTPIVVEAKPGAVQPAPHEAARQAPRVRSLPRSQTLRII